MHVEDIDVVCPQLRERLLDRDMHALKVVPDVVRLLLDLLVGELVQCSVLTAKSWSIYR